MIRGFAARSRACVVLWKPTQADYNKLSFKSSYIKLEFNIAIAFHFDNRYININCVI